MTYKPNQGDIVMMNLARGVSYVETLLVDLQEEVLERVRLSIE